MNDAITTRATPWWNALPEGSYSLAVYCGCGTGPIKDACPGHQRNSTIGHQTFHRTRTGLRTGVVYREPGADLNAVINNSRDRSEVARYLTSPALAAAARIAYDHLTNRRRHQLRQTKADR